MKIQNSSYAGVCSTVKRLCVSHVWYRYCDGFGPTYRIYNSYGLRALCIVVACYLDGMLEDTLFVTPIHLLAGEEEIQVCIILRHFPIDSKFGTIHLCVSGNLYFNGEE